MSAETFGIRSPIAPAKPYLGMFRMRLIANMQYRAAAWAGIATQFFFGGFYLLVYYVFYQSSGTQEVMTFGQLADFVWMRQAFLALVMMWSMDNELLTLITSGNVAYELARPLSLYSFWFARVLAFRIARTALRCLPILIVTSFLPEPWRFHLPYNFSALMHFIPSLVLTALLATALSMFICGLTFATMNIIGSRILMGAAAEFLMGAYIPIPFMPLAMQRVVNLLPFRYLADFPFRVYSGNIAGTEALYGLGIQAFWTAATILLGVVCFKLSLRRLVIQGG